MKLSKNRFFQINLLLILLGILITGCRETPTKQPVTPSPAAKTQTPTNLPPSEGQTTPTPTKTRRPTSTPTQAPLGEAENPIVIGFILPITDEERVNAAEAIAFLIEKDTGYAIESRMFTDFASLSNAIMQNQVDLFWLEPLEYIYLNWEEQAQVLLVSNHLGVTAYGVQFLAHQTRGFIPNFDPDTNNSPDDPIATLQQFAGTRPCMISSESLPGYLVPMGLLANASTPTLDPVFTYNYTSTIRALYIQGICDFGVSYALTGDPRTNSEILLNFPNVQENVITIWQSPPMIPNLNLSAGIRVPLNIQIRLQEAFLDLAQSSEDLQTLSDALNYEISGLSTVDDLFYNPLRDVLIPLELDLAEINQK